MWLGIDTTTERLGLALVEAESVLAAETAFVYRDMAAVLHPRLQDMLRRSGVRAAELSGIAVTCGPGSYTGMRLGLAAAQGLALVTGCPVAGVNAQAAIARKCAQEGRPTVVVSRANAGDVYVAVFGPDGRVLHDTALVDMATAAQLVPAGAVLTGNAAVLLDVAGVTPIEGDDLTHPDPVDVARIGMADYAAGTLRQASPMYLHPLAYRTSPGLKS
ncbi:MAG: tRNA (adenosine(37)-N6)-threonylcarbamoyltransferase complex dimerization subunit type 1 TsaB [Proteobacteria bacterium]|nr:tRNA (adenosine(37)-N6)-threonylcarbamoyltransferase complex dimerization subunit type 1 TsaB [Pseudomonadota bacterium]